MPITSIPTKTIGSLGSELTDTRAPADNEASAVHYERIKDSLIELYNEFGLSDGSSVGSVNERLATAVFDSDFAGSSLGVLTRTGANTYAVIKEKLDATAAPAVTDDSASGYGVGSRWIDITNDHVYICVDATPSAAIWKQSDSSSSAGTGDVVGRASSTDRAIARYDGVTGKLLKNSAVTIDDLGNIDGRDISADGAVLDGLVTRQIIAGAGLTGGGDLSANRTLNISAHADGSIVVNADDIQVGVLATDAQHGNRGNGDLHGIAEAGVAHGFMSSSDKTKLDALAATTVTTDAGTAISMADADHEKVVRCTAATTVTVTVGAGLTAGTTVE